MVIIQALENLIAKAEKEQDNMALVILLSFKEYVENGGKLSKLTWFNGLNMEELETKHREVA